MKLIVCIAFPIVWVLSVIIHGVVISTLWEWFFVTAFEVPSISVPAAAGMHLMITYMTINDQINEAPEQFKEAFVHDAVSLGIKPLLFLFFGWIIKFFV